MLINETDRGLILLGLHFYKPYLCKSEFYFFFLVSSPYNSSKLFYYTFLDGEFFSIFIR